MSTSKPGSRVLAIQSAGREDSSGLFVLKIYGVGTYVGETVPQEGAGSIAKVLRECEAPNPTIKLDSGELVYGCESWWGGLDMCLQRYQLNEDLTPKDPQVRVEFVSISKAREEYYAAKAAQERVEAEVLQEAIDDLKDPL